jgi:hypothetical protein
MLCVSLPPKSLLKRRPCSPLLFSPRKQPSKGINISRVQHSDFTTTTLSLFSRKLPGPLRNVFSSAVPTKSQERPAACLAVVACLESRNMKSQYMLRLCACCRIDMESINSWLSNSDECKYFLGLPPCSDNTHFPFFYSKKIGSDHLYLLFSSLFSKRPLN